MPIIGNLLERNSMSSFLEVSKLLTSTKEYVTESIKHPDIAWLLNTSACERCMRFLETLDASDTDVDEQVRRYEAGCLLVILAAMEREDKHDVLELLRLMGAKNVDARVRELPRRRQLAGEARERPVTDPVHYKRYGHLAQAQQQLAAELHALVARPARLEAALETNGATAVARHL
jgi:hypothetical protein